MVPAAAAGSAGPGGLPRRAPQANMAPQLRENRPTAPKGPLAGRSPEQARSLMSAIQQGLRSGRAAGAQEDGDSAPGDSAPGDSAPGGESTGTGWSQR